jgi:CMP-N,N'-diacetyllegionaminic acid synthase
VKVLGIIPARAGSKRLPGKNTRELGGKPLVAWVIEAARASRRLARLVVSSDDARVLEIARSYDPQLALARPAELASDTSPAIDYVRHALAAAGSGFDAIAILQPSSPLTSPADIDGTLELLEHSGADTAVSVMRLDHAVHPAKLKRFAGDRLVPYLEEERGRMAEHELPEVWVRNCAVYATRLAVIERGVIIGDDCRGYRMPRERSVDINEEIDLQLAGLLLARSRSPT